MTVVVDERLLMLKASVFIFLLAQSMLLQAESTDTAGLAPVVVDRPALVDEQQKYQHHVFPGWSERSQSKKEIIPPPPPGPYMSNALSDFSVEGRTFGRDLNKPAAFDPSKVSMDTFSPDRTWPESKKHNRNNSATNRWMPESGYRYVKPQQEKKYSQLMSKMPSMGLSHGAANPVRPYFIPPNYVSGYNKPVNRAPYPRVGN